MSACRCPEGGRALEQVLGCSFRWSRVYNCRGSRALVRATRLAAELDLVNCMDELQDPTSPPRKFTLQAGGAGNARDGWLPLRVGSARTCSAGQPANRGAAGCGWHSPKWAQLTLTQSATAGSFLAWPGSGGTAANLRLANLAPMACPTQWRSLQTCTLPISGASSHGSHCSRRKAVCTFCEVNIYGCKRERVWPNRPLVRKGRKVAKT